MAIFQTVHSQQSLKDHYVFCSQQNRLPFPATFVILIAFNNLFLVFNSSINFVIYCAIRKSFRQCIIRLFKTIFCLEPYRSDFNPGSKYSVHQ